MDLLVGEDHADLYTWSAALLAHALIGLGLTGISAAILDGLDRSDRLPMRGGMACALVVFGYLAGWEAGVQGLAEGLAGSLVDTLGIAAGGLIGLSAWARHGRSVALGFVVLLVTWLVGKRGRK